MQYVSKMLAAGGLVIMTGPLSFVAQSQDYVDVEAERAAAEAAQGAGAVSTPADPYGAKPATAYPATSFGVNTAPAASTGTGSSGAATGQGSGSNLGNLFYQIQQLQQEVRRLNGVVEEQAHELRMLKEQSLQRYMDLDKRLSGAPAQAAGESSSASSVSGPAAVSPEPAANRSATPGVEQAGEADAYRAAYALVQGRQFEQALPAFQRFLRSYPDGKYAANAHYWLGELYLVSEPPDLESARQSFALLLHEYPNNSKAADALYKLGKVQFMKGNREKAREYLDLVIRQYENSNPAVVKLAREFITENY